MDLTSAASCRRRNPTKLQIGPTRSAGGYMQSDHRVIMCNDGGTLAAPAMEAPIGIAGLVAGTIDILRNTSVNTLYWQLGTDPFYGTLTHRLTDWYSHRTKVGP